MNEDQITIWLSGLKQQDSRAVEVIWQQYFAKLIRLARDKVRRVPGRAFDEEDVALSAMNSFFEGAHAGRFPQLDDRDDLWRVLAAVTARKAQKYLRRQFAAKRGGGKVRGESVFLQTSEPVSDGFAEVLGSEPTPELAAQMAETCQTMLAALDDELLRSIALLKLHGYTNDEIAARIDRTSRTVERKLELIRRKWQRSVP